MTILVPCLQLPLPLSILFSIWVDSPKCSHFFKESDFSNAPEAEYQIPFLKISSISNIGNDSIIQACPPCGPGQL